MHRALLDMDGVFVDFMLGSCQAHGKSWPYNRPESKGVYEVWRLFDLTEAQFWAQCSHIDFWMRLAWLPDGKEIISIVEKHFGEENVCLLSHPISPASSFGKHHWIEEHLPSYAKAARFLLGGGKHFAESPSNVLIDDRDENCERYKKEGGAAILVPRPWNKLHGADTIPTLKKELKKLRRK